MKSTIDTKLALAGVTADAVIIDNILENGKTHALCGFESSGCLEKFVEDVANYAKAEYGEDIPATMEGMESLKEIYAKLSKSLKDMLDTKNLIKGTPFTIKLSIERFESQQWKKDYQTQEPTATIFAIPAYHDCKNIDGFRNVITDVTGKIDRGVSNSLSSVCNRSKKGIEIFKGAVKLKQKELYNSEDVSAYKDNLSEVDAYISKELGKLPKEIEVTEEKVLKDIGLTTYNHFEPISLQPIAPNEMMDALNLLRVCLKIAENCEGALEKANDVQLDPEAFDALLSDMEEPTSQQKALFDVISAGDKKLNKLVEIYYDCIISLAQGVEKYINASFSKTK